MQESKKNIYSLLILVAVVVLSTLLMSCEEQDFTYKGTAFVRFDDTALVYKEYYSKAIKVRVHNGGIPLEESIIVNYTIGGTAREGKDYKIQGTKGTVVIPARESFGEISILLLNNANNILESSNIEFTITNVTPSDKVKAGLGEGGLGTKMTFTIKDACIMEGIYTGLLPVKTQFYPRENIDITSTNCKNYIVSNINVGLVGFDQFYNYEPLVGLQAEKPQLEFIDNGDNTLTIPKQVISEFPAGYDTLSGTGIWNPVNKRITLNIRWKVYNLATKRDTSVVIPLTYVPQ